MVQRHPKSGLIIHELSSGVRKMDVLRKIPESYSIFLMSLCKWQQNIQYLIFVSEG
jgi:hypothetical protein